MKRKKSSFNLISLMFKLITCLFLTLLFIYQTCVSPYLLKSCLFSPTCSNYAKEVIKKYPIPKALYLILKRILKCHPFSHGGDDYP